METTSIKVWPALGVEVSADRARTWVARAAVRGDVVIVELCDPIVGTASVAEALEEWHRSWSVEAIGVDPRSPSATLVKPLQDARLPLRLTDAHATAVSHGAFQDLLTAGRLRIRGHGALDDAARSAQERRLAGAYALNRYEGTDQAPLVAAELAAWALLNAEREQQFFGAWR